MPDHITTAAAITQYGLTRQQIKDGIEAGVIEAWSVSKPGSERTHWRMTPDSVRAYPSDLQAYARSLAGADS